MFNDKIFNLPLEICTLSLQQGKEESGQERVCMLKEDGNLTKGSVYVFPSPKRLSDPLRCFLKAAEEDVLRCLSLGKDSIK